MYTLSIGFVASLTFYFKYNNSLAQAKILLFNLHYTKLYKICLLSHCQLNLKKLNAYVGKVRFFKA